VLDLCHPSKPAVHQPKSSSQDHQMLAIPKVSASEPNLLGGIFLLRGISKLKRLDSQVDKSVDRKVSWEAIAPDLEQDGI
jgi:hypothetical protein